MTDTIVLVDADSIVYSCAFAGQKKSDFDGSIVLEPIENVLHAVRLTLEGMIREYAKSDRLEIYLTASEGKSFRHEIARQREYKANRTAPRPEYYGAVREYLVKHHGAQVCLNCEADDQISIDAAALRSRDVDYLVATIDKDLDQIPGRHYNYAKKVGYSVSEEEAERCFWIQALAGDPTDNVPGCWKVGRTRAGQAIDVLIASEPDQIWDEIVCFYEKSQEHPKCPYRDRAAEDVALETAQLVYLQRKPGELWFPPQAGGPRVLTAEEWNGLRHAA